MANVILHKKDKVKLDKSTFLFTFDEEMNVYKLWVSTKVENCSGLLKACICSVAGFDF